MEKIYDFNWLIGDIDESIIFMLRDGKEMLGSYYVSELSTNGIDGTNIKFANINDLTNFINFTIVRFVHSQDNTNIIEIPLRNLQVLYRKANEIAEDKPQGISLAEIDAICFNDKAVLRNGYAIYAYKINEPTEELQEVMHLTHDFNDLNMNDKIDALEEINLINYQRNKTTKHR